MGGGGGGGVVILTFTVFGVHARYGLQHLDTIFHKIRVFLREKSLAKKEQSHVFC